MEWGSDKIKHYKLAFKIGRYGSVFGFMLIATRLAPGKELWDWIRSKYGARLQKITAWIKSDKLKNWLSPNHKAEWSDYKAGVIGAFDGMLIFKKSRFK